MSERDELIKAARPFADWPIGPEMIDDPDLVLHRNAGRMITVGDVLRLRDTILSPRGEQTEAVAEHGMRGVVARARAENWPTTSAFIAAAKAGAEAPSVVDLADAIYRHVEPLLAEYSEPNREDYVAAILAALSPQALGEAHGSSPGGDTHRVAETPVVGDPMVFGAGRFVVDTGCYQQRPAVFICPVDKPGEVGTSARALGHDRHSLQPGERVMTFPTVAQAQAVADALVGQIAAPSPKAGDAK